MNATWEQEKIVIVDKNDNELGTMDKNICHKVKGILHRAITIFIINDKNQILITKRSTYKKLWPKHWESSCSTHVLENESYVEAGERRIKQELGISCKLNYLLKFNYKAAYKNIGSENEICALLIGKFNGSINSNPREISDHRWVSFDDLGYAIEFDGGRYVPWLAVAFKEFIKIKEIVGNKLQVCVAAIVVKGGKILIFKEKNNKAYEKAKGLWTVPIGKTRESELLLKSVLRETREEVGYSIEILGLIGVYEFFSSKTNNRILGLAFKAIPIDNKRSRLREFKKLYWVDQKKLLQDKKLKFRKGVKAIIKDFIGGKLLEVKQIKSL